MLLFSVSLHFFRMISVEYPLRMRASALPARHVSGFAAPDREDHRAHLAVNVQAPGINSTLRCCFHHKTASGKWQLQTTAGSCGGSNTIALRICKVLFAKVEEDGLSKEEPARISCVCVCVRHLQSYDTKSSVLTCFAAFAV